jgi:HK97 gp10 family phage protein
MLKFKTNSSKVAAQLKNDTKYLCEKEMRGVVAKAVDAVRDQAKANAIAIGLGQAGMVPDSSGRQRMRQGQIPGAIYSYVKKNEGSIVSGAVKIKKTRATFHAGFIEFGTRFRPPKPFFRRALEEASGAALSAAQARFDEAVGRMLK